MKNSKGVKLVQGLRNSACVSVMFLCGPRKNPALCLPHHCFAVPLLCLEQLFVSDMSPEEKLQLAKDSSCSLGKPQGLSLSQCVPYKTHKRLPVCIHVSSLRHKRLPVPLKSKLALYYFSIFTLLSRRPVTIVHT